MGKKYTTLRTKIRYTIAIKLSKFSTASLSTVRDVYLQVITVKKVYFVYKWQ